MRPYSHIRLALESALLDGGGTCAELAARINEPAHRVRVVLDNMCRAEHAAKAAPVRRPGVKRSVPVYVRPALPPVQGHTTLLHMWLQPYLSREQVAAM